ncbi:MAG TPA: transposase [Candidatus Thermoplasmatota archaeon]
MRRAFKFRLYPTREQRVRIEQQFYQCRRLYNAMLEQRRTAWRSHRISLGLFEQSRQIVDVVHALPEYAAMYSQVLRHTAKPLDLAFQAFFRRIRAGEKPGFPRFRGRHRWDSLTYPQAQNGSVRIHDDRVSLSKLVENVRFVQHRTLEGTVKTATISREADRWFLILTCDHVPPRLIAGSSEIGLDVGLTHLATTDAGFVLENPRFEQHALERLRNAHRRVSRGTKGSHRRRKTLLLLQKAYLKIRDQRRYHYHKLARTLVVQNRRIAVEAIHPSQMLNASPSSNRNIHDAAWTLFLSILRRKAEEAGATVVDVNPAYTTQTCSQCGARAPKPLWQRVHQCVCGLVLDRDVNAAKNILNQARLEPSWTTPMGVG